MVCPQCGAEYRPGFTRCSDCDVPLVEPAPAAAPAGGDEWVVVYTGSQVEAELLEAELAGMGLSAAREAHPGTSELSVPFELAMTPGAGRFDVRVPAAEYESRRAEIESAITGLSSREGDAAAEAEAEEDYDVRGCPACRLYFHDNYAACPGCGSALLPAVEIFEDGQTEPDRVIVAHGSEEEMRALAARLQQTGIDGAAQAVEDWPVAALDVPWAHLIDRTADIEALLDYAKP